LQIPPSGGGEASLHLNELMESSPQEDRERPAAAEGAKIQRTNHLSSRPGKRSMGSAEDGSEISKNSELPSLAYGIGRNWGIGTGLVPL